MNRNHREISLDKLLKIRTNGRDDSISNTMNYPYEPTPYSVLERLANEGYIKKNNVVLDYGCGKGRVDFYLSYQTRCQSIGIDYDERMIRAALDNQKNTAYAGRTSFICGNAVDYRIPVEVDCCYFFHPFSVEILNSVLARIEESYYEKQREILLFFYYPSDEYIALLMQCEYLTFLDEISCQDLFEGNNERERVMIFHIEQKRLSL